MVKQNQLIRSDVRKLNSYDMMYNAVSRKPAFYQEDWVNAANSGTLDSYVDMLLKSDGIDYDAVKQKYNLDFADSKTRTMALYNELEANRENVTEKRKRVVETPNGPVEQEYEASDYEYNLSLIREHNDYNKLMVERAQAQNLKDGMSTWDHIAGVGIGTVTSLTAGALNAIDDLTALAGGVVNAIGAEKGQRTDAFVRSIASDKWRMFAGVSEALVDFESRYTSMRDIDGNYGDYGKYIGGALTSLGEMLPSMLIDAGVGGVVSKIAGPTAKIASTAGTVASRTSFYAGMASGTIQDTYKHFEASGADVDSAHILADSAIKSAMQFGVEYLLGKGFGATSLDNMVFGANMSSVTSKSLTGAGVKNLFKDVLQEGLEEVLQDTSDFLVDRAYGVFINEFKDVTSISFQSLFDAFVLGGLMSFAGSARNIVSIENVYAGDKKLNKIASWQYGINIQSFAESMEAIDKAVHHIDLRGEIGPAKFNLDKKSHKAAEAAIIESYAAYRMISSVYQEIGDERFNAANQILDEITKKIKSGFFEISDINSYVDKIKVQLKGMAESSIKKIATEIQEAGVSEVKNAVTKDEKAVDSTEKKAQELAKELDVSEVKVTDGGPLLIVDGKLIIGENRLKGKDVNQILKNASILKFVSKMETLISNTDVFNEIKTIYGDFIGKDTFSNKEVMSALLFDRSFLDVLLKVGDKRVYRTLAYFDNLMEDVRDKRIKSDAIYVESIKAIKDNFIDAMTLYNSVNLTADPSYFLDFIKDKDRRDECELKIRKGRYAVRSLNVAVGKGFGALDDNGKRLLKGLLDRYYNSTDAELRWKMIQSDDIKNRRNALSSLYSKIRANYDGDYNDVIYLRENTVQACVFNLYLKRIGIDMRNWLSQASLTDAEIKLIQSRYNKINRQTIFYLRNEQFSNMTNGKYRVNRVGEKVEIVTTKMYQTDYSDFREGAYSRGGYTSYNRYDADSDEDVYHMPVGEHLHDTSVADFLSEKVPKSYRKFVTVDDIIKDVNLINEKTKLDITKFALEKLNIKISSLDSEIVYLYLRDFYNEKHDVLLGERQDGYYVLLDMKPMLDCLTSRQAEITKDSTVESLVKKEYIPEGLTLEFFTPTEPIGVSGYFVDYDDDGNLVNTIYLPDTLLKDKSANGKAFLRFAFLHELDHAIQFEKYLNLGSSIEWTHHISESDKKRLIKTLRKHYSGSTGFIDKDMSDELVLDVAGYLGYHSTGELYSLGIYGDPLIKFLPFKVTSDNGIMTMRLPTGESFTLNYSPKSLTAGRPSYETSIQLPKFTLAKYQKSDGDDEIRKPRKNELREDDPRAKNFVHSESGPSHKYDARYFVINPDGTQKFHKDGTPAYNYVNKPSKDRTAGRYTGIRKYKGTNLEHFIKKYNVTQMTKEFRNFVLNAKDLDPILQERINGSKAGTLTERDVMDYFRSAEKIDDKTFKAINDAFFKNEYVTSLKELDDRFATKLGQAWAFYRLVNEDDKMSSYKKLLTSKSTDITFLVEAVESHKDVNVAKHYGRLYSNFENFFGRSLELKPEYGRMAYMKLYDGTIESEWAIAARVRYPEIHYMNTTRKTQLSNDEKTAEQEAYSELVAGIDLSRGAMIDAIRTREMARLAKEVIDQGGNYRDNVSDIIDKADELVERLEKLSTVQIAKMYEDEGGIGKVVVEGVIASTTGAVVDVPNDVPVITSRAIVNNIRGFLNTIRRNLNPKERDNFVKEHSDLFERDLRLKREVYQNEIPNKTVGGVHYRNKSPEELRELLDKVAEIKNKLLEEKRLAKESIKIKEKRDREQQRRIRELERENELLRKGDGKHKSYKDTVTEFIVENEVISVRTNVPIPDVLKLFLQGQYEKKAKTTVKNLAEADEKHVKMISKDFYEHNAEKLNHLTQGDVNEIIDFYTKPNVPLSEVTAQYIATEVWMLTYLIECGRKGSANFVIDANTLSLLESTLKNLQSTFGTGQVTWREALKKLNPEVVIAKQLANSIGIEIADGDMKSLLNAVESRDTKAIEKEKNRIYTKYLKSVRDNRAKRAKLDRILEKILQYERLAMLSGPGTWVRNWSSNFMIAGTNKLSDGMSGKMESLLTKLFPQSEKVKDQYKIAGTKVTDEVRQYIENNLLNNGLLDMVMESLVKYDVRKDRRGDESATVLTELIANSIKTMYRTEHLSNNKHAMKVEDFIRSMISDNKSVKKAAISYLGKMITEDLENNRVKSKTELLSENRISKQFLNYVAEAYKIAGHDYMHKSNPLMALESKLAHKSYGAYFMYKQLFPFAGASWNWFMEGFNYTPIGLAKSIINFAKLEKTVEKMDEDRRTYANNDIGVSSNFAKYLTIRNINKGVIGSVGCIVGVLLSAFGLARIDEEDDKYKLVIGDNVYIDISDIFGTQGIFLGIAVTDAIINKNSVIDVTAAALDQLFIDSTFADVFNNFRYSKTFGDWLTYQPISMLNMMIPNFLKTLTSISTPYNVKYSDGIMGKIERLCTSAIPGLSYAFPHYYDPYTGEKQIPYKMWFLTKSIDKLTPLGLHVYNVSEYEKLCIAYGINKSQLTGRYDVNDEQIKLKSSDVEKLNKYYGSLNVESFKEFNSNTKFKIQQSDGSYKWYRFSQLSEKEKAAVISRTMTNNSGYAKVYILTESGKYKYYADEAEYKELRTLGITKNVYKASKKNKGFVKIS